MKDETNQKAAQAGRRAVRESHGEKMQPYGKETLGSWQDLAIWMVTMAALFYAGAQVHGVARWFLWVVAAGRTLTTLLFYGVSRKILRRRWFMAREQVWRVRQIKADDPVATRIGLLCDADPMVDPTSAQAGAVFMHSLVAETLAQVERETPMPTWGSLRLNDDGTATKK